MPNPLDRLVTFVVDSGTFYTSSVAELVHEPEDRMMTKRAVAITALLAKPDPPGLPLTGHHLTQAGDPTRQHRLKSRLPLIYIQYVRQEREDGIGESHLATGELWRGV
jgi:hypothetical protein